MNLRDWASNSKEVINKIPEGDKTQTERIKLLGLSWILEKDHMSISCHAVVDSQSSITKRIVLKQIASAFDPLGVFSPVILRGKLFLQTLWNENLAWDEKLSPKDTTQWFSVRDDLQRLPNTTFPRYIGFLEAGIRTYKLLVFCDASQLAYAAAVYLYQECKNVRKVDLIFSKTRLAPNKNISIPRLELLATVIGTRCLQFVQKAENRYSRKTHLVGFTVCTVLVRQQQASQYICREQDKRDQAKRRCKFSLYTVKGKLSRYCYQRRLYY